ncbi:GMP synthase [archaeon SCG-AAA382B04]|nr:GMP synthase [archaeon SCG-AAA382B04]
MILVVNNHGQFTHLIHRALRDLGVENELIDNQTPLDEVQEKGSGLILSGGPDITKTGLCREYIKEVDIPILGICLGHQLIADTLGGKIGTGAAGGYAEIELEILENDVLFKGFGKDTNIWASHSDEVKKVPSNFKVLAKSEVCDVEAMWDKENDVFGIQGHPEVTHTPRGNDILMNFIDVCDL